MNNLIKENRAWSELPATEKENYLLFHQSLFQEDVKHAEKNVLEFPRWSVISGYYCMHNCAKLFLAEKFNVKISSPEIHAKTIDALEYFVKEPEVKKKLLILLKDAKNMYYSAEHLKEKILHVLLQRGKQERGKAQYYSEEYNEGKKVNSQKAIYFLDAVVKPFIELIMEVKK